MSISNASVLSSEFALQLEAEKKTERKNNSNGYEKRVSHFVVSASRSLSRLFVRSLCVHGGGKANCQHFLCILYALKLSQKYTVAYPLTVYQLALTRSVERKQFIESL